MMRKTANILGFLALVFVSSAEAQMGTGRVTGTVKDTEGNPIVGAEIVAQMEGTGIEIDATSDEDGEWAAIGFRGGRWTFTVTADGYAPTADTLQIKGLSRNPPVNIVMEPVKKGRAVSEEANTLLQEANALYRRKDYDGALAKYQELLEANPTLYQLHLNIGNVYREKGELEKAVEEYELVLQDAPSDTLALVSAGEVMVKQGNLEEALGYFEKAVATSPGDETLPFNVAEICFNKGAVEKAIEYYQKAAQVKPDWPDPHMKLGLAHINRGQLDEAAASLQKVVELAPDSPQAQQAQSILDQLGN